MSANANGRFQVRVEGPLQVAETVALELHYAPPPGGMQTGGNLWFFYDIRQFGERRQTYRTADAITVHGPSGTAWQAEGAP